MPRLLPCLLAALAACLLLASCETLQTKQYVDTETNCFVCTRSPTVRICFSEHFTNCQTEEGARPAQLLYRPESRFTERNFYVFRDQGGDGRPDAAVAIHIHRLRPNAQTYWLPEDYTGEEVLFQDQRRLGKFVYEGAAILQAISGTANEKENGPEQSAERHTHRIMYRLVTFLSGSTVKFAITYMEGLTTKQYESYRQKGMDSPHLDGFMQRCESAFSVE